MSTFARRVCSAVAILLAAAVLPLAAQQTLRVPQDFPSIQAAINAAATGDTVLVAPDTYFENLSIDRKEITLISSGSAARTILDGSHLGPVLKITNTNGNGTVVANFTFQNGSPLGAGAGILSVGPAGLLIANSGVHVSGSSFQKNAGINIGVINGSVDLNANQISTASTANGSCSLASGGSFANPSTGVYLSGTTTVSVPGPASTTSLVPSLLNGNTVFGDGTRCSGIGVQAVNVTPRLLLRNNIIRNNSLGISASSSAFELQQSLLYDNVAGALNIATPLTTHPSTAPATTLLLNDTFVNNLTSPDPQSSQSADITLTGTVAQIAFRNSILVGTTPHPVLSCETQTPSANDTPLILDHNDVFNTSAGPTLAGDCTPTIASPLAVNGNFSADPRLSGSTDLHPQAGSPAIDTGLNSSEQPSTDLDGNPRTADATGRGYPVIDLGAYEHVAPASPAAATFLDVTPFASRTSSLNPPSLLSTFSTPTYVTSTGTLPVFASIGAFTSGQITPVTSGTVTLLRDGTPVDTATPDGDGFLALSLPLPAPGVVTLTAQYTPSSGLAPSTSPVAYLLVTPAPPPPVTTLTLAASPTTQALNRPITLTIHLGSATTSGPTTTSGPVPPGDVTLYDGATLLSTLQPDASGLATYTLPKPALGTHTYRVVYAGTTLYPAATATAAVTVTAPIATSVTARPDHNPIALGEAVGCTATVVAASGPAPTGTVFFTDGASPAGSIPLDDSAEQGLVTLILYNLSFGLHTITVTFVGDPGFSSSSGTCTVNVGGRPTVTTLASSRNPALTTDTVTYTATVANTGSAGATAAPAGSISLSEGTTLLATAPLLASAAGSGTATLPVALGTPGVHLLTAAYLPATSATFASSATLSETVTAPAPISTALSASPNPVTFGQPTVLSATVTSTAGGIAAPATVTFTDGATVLGSALLPPSGPATLPVSTLSIGSHQIGAVLHTADTAAVRSTANPLTLQVTVLPDTLALAVSPRPSASATAPLTLIATLSAATPLPSGITLGGAITFLDGKLPLGTATVAADGRATLTTGALTPGTHTLTATYSGSSVFAPATSAPATEQVNPNPTATSLSVTPASVSAFSPVTLAAHVAAPTTGTRINTAVCTPACAPVSVTFAADTSTGHTVLGTAAVDATGNAAITLTPPAGTYTLAATFNGTPLFSPSASPTATLVVNPLAVTLSLTANPNAVHPHSTITLSATLTTSGLPASAVSGTVTFFEDTTALGTVPLASAASFPYTPVGVGEHHLTAVFSGNPDLLGASAAVTVTVTALTSDFALSVKDGTLTIPTTHHAPTAITINALGGLSDQVDLSCRDLPQFASCTFSPSTHDLRAATTTAGTLTLDTDALLNYASLRTSPRSPRTRSTTPFTGGASTTLLALSLPSALFAGLRRLRRRRTSAARPALPHLLATLLLSAAAALTLSGCSGLYPPHVTPGTYTVTVVGHSRTSAIEHTTTLTLVVTK